MTVENSSWSISMKECCRPRRKIACKCENGENVSMYIHNMERKRLNKEKEEYVWSNWSTKQIDVQNLYFNVHNIKRKKTEQRNWWQHLIKLINKTDWCAQSTCTLYLEKKDWTKKRKNTNLYFNEQNMERKNIEKRKGRIRLINLINKTNWCAQCTNYPVFLIVSTFVNQS